MKTEQNKAAWLVCFRLTQSQHKQQSTGVILSKLSTPSIASVLCSFSCYCVNELPSKRKRESLSLQLNYINLTLISIDFLPPTGSGRRKAFTGNVLLVH